MLFQFIFVLIDNAITGGVASVVTDIAAYPVTRFNQTIKGQKTKKWSPYDFTDLVTEIKSLFITAFPYGFVFDIAFTHSYSAFTKLKLPNKLCISMGGALSESIAQLFRIPMTNLSNALQNNKSSSFRSTWKTLCKEKGCKGFYEGYLPTIISSAPFFAIMMPLYDHLKSKVMKEKKIFKLNDCLWISAVSITVSNIIMNPVDVITGNLKNANKSLCPKNYFQELKRIVSTGTPIPTLFKNLSDKNMFGILGVIYIATNEKLNELVQKHNMF